LIRWLFEFNLEASENVRRDRELFVSSYGRNFPVLVRVHSFKGRCATFGTLSRPGKRVTEWFKAYQVPFEKRLTGGGIALHGNDLCFSFFIQRKVASHVSFFFLADQVKRIFSACLSDSLCDLFSPTDLTFPGGEMGDFCFMGRGKQDILLGGVKVAGMAGKVGRRTLLIQVQVNSIGWEEELVRKLTGFELPLPGWRERVGALISTKGFVERVRYEIGEALSPLIRGETVGDHPKGGVKVIGNF